MGNATTVAANATTVAVNATAVAVNGTTFAVNATTVAVNATTVTVDAAVVSESFARPCIKISLQPFNNDELKVERPRVCFFMSSVLPDWNQAQSTNVRKASIKYLPFN